MSTVEQFLQSVDTPNSLFLCRAPELETWISTDYDKLTELLVHSLFESNQNYRLMADWTYAPTHPLIFEIPLKEKSEKNTFDFLMRYVDLVFLKVLQNYVPLLEMTILLAMGQSQTTGLRIYVLGVELSHDDYRDLCKLMRNECVYSEQDWAVYLDIPSQFPLPSCDRPDGTGDLYKPVRLLHVRYEFYQEHGVWHSFRLQNISIETEDRDSLFSRLVNHPDSWKEMARLMMPVPQPNATYLHFPASIYADYEDSHLYASTEIPLAALKSYLNGETYSIRKKSVLRAGKSFCYDFMKENANHIQLIRSHNSLFLTWYDRFRQISPPDEFHPIQYKQNMTLEDIDCELKILCPHLKDEASPLKKVLKTRTRPVYYALCNLTRDVDRIREHFPFLPSDLPSEPPPEATHLNFHTILYCAYSAGEGLFFANVVAGLDWIVTATATPQYLLEHVRWFQKRVFPIVYGPENAYWWDPTIEKWFALEKPIQQVSVILMTIVDIINTYFKLSPELLKGTKNDRMLETMASDIMSDLSIYEGSSVTEPLEVCEQNVPQYYFFKRDRMKK